MPKALEFKPGFPYKQSDQEMGKAVCPIHVNHREFLFDVVAAQGQNIRSTFDLASMICEVLNAAALDPEFEKHYGHFLRVMLNRIKG